MVASILSVAQNVGYPTLVLLVLAESAGVPVPGETGLITAAVCWRHSIDWRSYW